VADPHWGKTHLRAEQDADREARSTVADPMCADIAADDFRFRAGSPALRLGIRQPVSIADTGLEPSYGARFIGRRLRTTVSPASMKFRGPVSVTIASSADGAQIRYTLDGACPTPSSALYTSPFMLTEPGVVRARSFVEGGADVVGARSIFTPPHPPLDDGFESTPVGSRARHGVTFEEKPGMTIRVAAEYAATGRHCLRITDGAGQRHAFNPHVFYRTDIGSGNARLTFHIRVDAKAEINIQWRQYSVAPFAVGPDIHIGPNGKLRSGRTTLCDLPVDEWVRIEVKGALGVDSDGTFTLSASHPQWEGTRVFGDLPYRDALRTLEWVGFIATGTEHAMTHLDNVSLVSP